MERKGKNKLKGELGGGRGTQEQQTLTFSITRQGKNQNQAKQSASNKADDHTQSASGAATILGSECTYRMSRSVAAWSIYDHLLTGTHLVQV